MPRQPRSKHESSLYHIILRGNERKRIFEFEEDKRRFLTTLAQAKEKSNFLIHAYCIMDNHVHLIVNSNGNDISVLMKSINVSYAYYYNQKYNRCGHLFQDRFRSELIDSDAYLLQLSKYIHRNPIKAGIADKPENYRWSSIGSYIYERSGSEFLVEAGKILGMIARVRAAAQNEYFKFVTEKDEISAMDVYEDAVQEECAKPKTISDMKQAEHELLKMMAERGVKKEQLNKEKKVRNDIIKEIRKNSTLTLKEIGELLGGLGESRVSRILKS